MMISSWSRLVLIVCLSLYVYNGVVLSCVNPGTQCKAVPEGKNNPPIGASMLQLFLSGANLKPDGSKVVNRPACDLSADKNIKDLQKKIADIQQAPRPQGRSRFEGRGTAMTILMVVSCIIPIAQCFFGGSGGVSNETITDITSSCFTQQFTYMENAINARIAEQATEKLRGYKESFDRIQEANLQYCNRCNGPDNPTECVPKCEPSYATRLMSFYDKAVADRREFIAAFRRDLWNVYSIKDICNIQFVAAAELAAISQLNDPSNFKLFSEYIKKDATECLSALSESIDFATHSLSGPDLTLAPAYRAFVYRDLKDWLETFNALSGTQGLGTGEKGREWKHGSDFMLRDTAIGRGWFSCWSKEDAWCSWQTCPGTGPRYTDSGEHATWAECKNERLKIRKIDYNGKDPIIRAQDSVNIFNHQDGRIFWGESRESVPGTISCDSHRLIFRCKVGDEFQERAHFIIEAYDWTGRRREKGEPILNRDYIVFSYASPPDHRKLKLTDGTIYIEGFLFVGRYN